MKDLEHALRESASLRPAVACDTPVPDPRGGDGSWPRPGCLLRVEDPTGAAPSITDTLNRWFEERGWQAALAYSADGPDGTMFGYVGGGTLCVVEGRWDGGDDSDPSVVPSPGVEVAVRCAEATAADTGN